MKLLQINNFAPHYRSAIYRLIGSELGADFVFGDKVQDIRPMDYSQLHRNVTIVHNVHLWHSCYQRGVMKYLFRDYDTYLMTGEFRNISIWLLLLGLRIMPGKRAFLWTHGWLGKEKGIKRFVTKLFFRLADGILVYNNRSRQLMIEGGIEARKIATIYNSLDYDYQLSVRKNLKPSEIYTNYFGNDNHTLIFIGRLTKAKRIDLVLDAIYELSAKGERYNFVLIGEGMEKEHLKAMVKERGLSETVWLYGACYDEEKNAELIYNADLCVSPGNVGLTAIHSMMYGCPVITNDDFNHQMPEFETIVEWKTGAFFHYGDYYSLSQSIRDWFHAPNYSREVIRQNCYREVASRWTPEKQIEILKSTFLKR